MPSNAAKWPTDLVRAVRLAIYRGFVDAGTAPDPADLCRAHGLSPERLEGLLRHLADDLDAIVLLPGSPYLWMAEPFSAVPTHYRVTSGASRWFGNCIWDALAILALVGRDGQVEALSQVDGADLVFEVRGDALTVEPSSAVIHFAVPASEWWYSIGFT